MQATFLRIGDSVGTRRISAVILRGQYFDGAGLEKIRAQVLIAPDIRIDEAASVNRPHPDLEIVEMPPLPAGDADSGTSLEGFIVAGHAQVDSFNLAFLAHEIGHQWWADCVYATGRANSLLTEAMAQYASLRAVEAIYGAEAAKEFRWRGYPGPACSRADEATRA